MNDRELHDLFDQSAREITAAEPDGSALWQRGRRARRRDRALVYGTTGLVTAGLVTGVVLIGDWGNDQTAPPASGVTTPTTSGVPTTPVDDGTVVPTYDASTPTEYSSFWTGPMSTVQTGPFQTTPAPPKFRTPPPFDDRPTNPPVMVDGVSVLTLTDPGEVDQTREHLPPGVLDAPTHGDARDAGQMPIHAARWANEPGDQATLEIMHSDRVWRSTQYAEGVRPVSITPADVVLPTRVYIVPGGEYVVVLHPESLSVIARDGSVRPIALPQGSRAAGLDTFTANQRAVHVVTDDGSAMPAIDLTTGEIYEEMEPSVPDLGKARDIGGWRLREAGVTHRDSSGRTVQQVWIETAPLGFAGPEVDVDEGVLALAVMDETGRELYELVVLPEPVRNVEDLSVIAVRPQGVLIRVLGSGGRPSWIGSYDGTSVAPLGVIDRGVTVSPDLIVPGSAPYGGITDPGDAPGIDGPGGPKFTPPPRG